MGLFTRAIIRLILAFIVLYLLLFVLGGNPRWLQGWIFYGILVLTVLANMLVLRRDPALLAERMGPAIRPGQPRMDRILLGLFGILYAAWYCIMPLDSQRLGWSPPFPLWLQLCGGLLLIAGCTLVNICFAQNSYLSTVVRVQAERGHRVIDTGLYAVVRHPMYFGVLCLLVGGALLLESIWGTLVAIIANLVLYIRSIHEEQVLLADLPGYDEYMRKVRYRLIPRLF